MDHTQLQLLLSLWSCLPEMYELQSWPPQAPPSGDTAKSQPLSPQLGKDPSPRPQTESANLHASAPLALGSFPALEYL